MNVFDPYPDTVEIDGTRYRLDMDFKVVLRCMDAAGDNGMTPEDRIDYQCSLLCARPPRDIRTKAEIVQAAFSLIPSAEHKSAEKFIDLHQDAKLIRSAFMRMGFDLTVCDMHINQFLELLADIPQDTALARVIDIRQRPLPKPTKHNGEQIARLQEAKARVAIRYSEEERREMFVESLRKSTVLRG